MSITSVVHYQYVLNFRRMTHHNVISPVYVHKYTSTVFTCKYRF